MGSKAPQWKQQSLTPEKQNPYEEDVKEIETCGPLGSITSRCSSICDPNISGSIDNNFGTSQHLGANGEPSNAR